MQKRRLASISVFLFTTATIFLFQNCGAGTDTGNPVNSRDPVDNLISLSTGIADAICEKVVECHPTVDVVACKAGVLQISGLPQRLGVPATWTTLASSHLAEVENLLAGDLDNAGACGLELSAVSCASTEAVNAYQPSNGQPYATADQLVPAGGACPTTFP